MEDQLSRKKIDIEKLKKIMQPHIRGEYDTLKDSHKGLTDGSINHGKSEGRIYLECLLLHARNLIDFFCNSRNVPCKKCTYCEDCKARNQKRQEDTVLAIDFFDKRARNSSFRNRNDILPDEIRQKNVENEEIHKRSWYSGLNKQLAHISFTRPKDKEVVRFARTWENSGNSNKIVFEAIYEGIEKLAKEFDQKISEEYNEADAKDLRIIKRN